jgi:hypothetical protein
MQATGIVLCCVCTAHIWLFTHTPDDEVVTAVSSFMARLDRVMNKVVRESPQK